MRCCNVHSFFTVFYWKCIRYRSQGATAYDYELVLTHKNHILTVNCFESECHFFFFPEKCAVFYWFKILHFQAARYKVMQAVKFLFPLSFCSFVCDVSCIQRYFISMTRYTEVLPKCERDRLLRYLWKTDNICPM